MSFLRNLQYHSDQLSTTFTKWLISGIRRENRLTKASKGLCFNLSPRMLMPLSAFESMFLWGPTVQSTYWQAGLYFILLSCWLLITDFIFHLPFYIFQHHPPEIIIKIRGSKQRHGRFLCPFFVCIMFIICLPLQLFHNCGNYVYDTTLLMLEYIFNWWLKMLLYCNIL